MEQMTKNRFLGHPAQHGFTMIELMVTVIVLAILTAVAIPSFRSFIVGQRIKTASFDLMSSLLMARSEAIKRNTNVDVTPGASWANGWNVAAGATVLKQQEALGNGLSITCFSGAAASPCAKVTYSGRGRLPAGSVMPSIQITANDANIASGFGTRCISIDLSGRPSSKRANCP